MLKHIIHLSPQSNKLIIFITGLAPLKVHSPYIYWGNLSKIRGFAYHILCHPIFLIQLQRGVLFLIIFALSAVYFCSAGSICEYQPEPGLPQTNLLYFNLCSPQKYQKKSEVHKRPGSCDPGLFLNCLLVIMSRDVFWA